MAIVRQPPPVVPIAGYSGADPVRAFQGMQGGIKGAVALPSLAQGIQQAGATRPRLDPLAGPPMQTALTGGGQNLTDAVRSPTSAIPTFSNIPGGNVGVKVNMPPSVAAGIQQAGASHSPGATVGGVSGTLASGGTLAGTTSPASKPSPLASPAPTSKPVTSVSQSVQTAGANHQVGSTAGGVGSSLSGNSLSSAKSPAATVPNMTPTTTAAEKLGGASAFSTSTHSAPSGLFNAADPNRALKMMRGY